MRRRKVTTVVPKRSAYPTVGRKYRFGDYVLEVTAVTGHKSGTRVHLYKWCSQTEDMVAVIWLPVDQWVGHVSDGTVTPTETTNAR
jgi:hypothetical protein